MRRLKIEQGSGKVFADLSFPPEEAQNLVLCAELVNQIEDMWLTAADLAAVSEEIGRNPARLKLLLKGKVNEFSIDALVNMAAKAGMKAKRAA